MGNSGEHQDLSSRRLGLRCKDSSSSLNCLFIVWLLCDPLALISCHPKPCCLPYESVSSRYLSEWHVLWLSAVRQQWLGAWVVVALDHLEELAGFLVLPSLLKTTLLTPQ